ncbi:FimV/HubP family polar landmark protein [Simiduia curdlanivorans]|uniref:FimV/HubP family polar landmark protein n=1 Tax=Simiduia curdlanivorans TaxID=1492769 RepID=A0ABV8VAJ1_9GAMM|nr:FimV/HubP family polar landmark protein [Simiduia curdlanivorans]MDN3639447.1 FimV/HubP family polar landmark protein [Simiduia curdlanivorans]
MRLRKLALAVGATAALVSNLGFALGLGEIKLNSALNQPLDAQIKLLQVRDLSEEEIIVRLATREAYERANVDRIFFLTGLKFEVVLDDPNNPHVRVTTKEDVREPYLNFLLETQWPTGRMLREYTVLMDLPTFSEKNQKAVAAPQQQAEPQQVKPRPEVRSATAAPAVRPPAPAVRPAPRTQASDGSYAVQANDTLWDIALMARPDRSYSVQQTMLAIQRLNPDAFINDNINLLKKGKVLRLPAADEISSLSTRQAINEVAYQNNQWSGGAALDASSRSGSVADRQSSREGRVQLSAGESSTDVSSGGGNSRQREILQNELAIAQEELGSARRQNSELVSRVEDLEAQITTMERMLEVTSDELRAMQLTAGQEVGAEEPVVSEPEAQEPEVKEPAAEPVRPANTVVVAPKPEPTLMDMVMDNILYVAIALVALLGGLFFWKRRKDAEAEQEEFDAFAEQDEEPEEEFSFPDDSDFDSAPDIEDEPVEPYEEVETAEAETADVAGEADIYIAYGKYDQAEDMLLKALDQEPGRVDVTLKLLEVYAETQNLEAFDTHYAGLLQNGDRAAKQRAEELRDSIPGAGDFDRTQVAAVGTAAAASTSAFDLDDDADPLLSLAEEGIDETDFDGLEGLDSLESDFGDLAAEQGLVSDEELELNLDDAEVSENVDELDFTLDGLDDDAEADAEESFSLDLDDSGASEDEALELDLDLSDDTEEFALDLGDLDVEPAPASSTADLSSVEPEQPAQEDDDFMLSLDDDLELSLDDAAEAEAEVETESDDFELSLDDELAVEEDEGFDLALDDELSLSPPADAGDLDADEELSVEADDFDSDDNFGDMDLAALDQEMETLSAGLDDEDDLSSLATETAAQDEIEEFDISADLGIEDGADDLPPLASPSVAADAMDSDLDDDDADAELGFLADSDEVATKLDLARAYIDMGDSEGAADILGEVMEEGDAQQKSEAQELLSRIG